MGFTQILLDDIRIYKIYMQEIEEIWSDPTKVWFKIGVHTSEEPKNSQVWNQTIHFFGPKNFTNTKQYLCFCR